MTALKRPLSPTLLLVALLAGCGTLDPKECDQIRGEAFELLNKAQHCNNDGDCRQSEWPGCSKPVSNATHDKIKPMSDKFTAGKCEEPKTECKEPPESYCKQGLCVHHEKGAPGGLGTKPAGSVKIE
jgi:hypothetical protein